MKKLTAFFAVIIVFVSSACNVSINGLGNMVQGSGKAVSENRTVSGIQGVSLELPGELTIKLGDQESLVVSADDNLMQYIQTSVSGGTLRIYQTSNTSLNFRTTPTYQLTVKSLNSISNSSSGNTTAPALQSDQFRLENSSSGNIHLAGIQTNTLSASISSSGNITIDNGTAQQQTVNISSSGSYEAGNVQSQTANATVSSSGTATIWVTNSLSANISSSGNVNYYGSPSVNQNTSSSGKVNSLGSK